MYRRAFTWFLLLSPLVAGALAHELDARAGGGGGYSGGGGGGKPPSNAAVLQQMGGEVVEALVATRVGDQGRLTVAARDALLTRFATRILDPALAAAADWTPYTATGPFRAQHTRPGPGAGRPAREGGLAAAPAPGGEKGHA